ncbi:Sulfite reductase [NADPH] flavoprotein alpha-component [Kingella potus]|uniref:Sulfite reductase [NADPH] flavoprotein alpha-component n=1 Tax=Kingella potus TaxID=265175 RepID=A0A377R5X1_9NEIS|nr:assimilatory sulfite reductase (NADPH) flavoprotein subunit [Kingella potus]STR03382.1 Sulfite reductase [NADPH] flavoprotein alpha-component [Kingella potus]
MNPNPLPPELSSALSALTPVQLAWLSGYCWAQAGGAAAVPQTPSENAATAAAAPPPAAPAAITVLSASQTGNARAVAGRLYEALMARELPATLVSCADYKPKNIAGEQILLLVVSTQGEGEPPEEALSLFKLLNGKKAPDLGGLKFAVLGLGDSSYPKFCGAAADFDARFAALGGTRLLPRTDCDLEFAAEAEAWIGRIVPAAAEASKPAASAPAAAPAAHSDGLAAPQNAYGKENPFPATLSVRQKITGRNSDKDVRHIEIDLSGSGISYTAGDALGVWFDNDGTLVSRLLAAVSLGGDEEIESGGTRKTLRDALTHDLEISQNTPQFVKGYAALAGSAELAQRAETDTAALVAEYPPVALAERYPAALAAAQLVALLRPLAPRLYSIASAQDEVGEEVHLTVGVLRYESDGKPFTGAASGYLGERLAEDDQVRVFVEHNPNFRLPPNPAAPVIMIGSGTGIAPFRAFMQQRAADGADGKNWLVFGNPHFTEDFLYQTEWQQFAKDGLLSKYSFAWSRDQEEKIYVQHRLRENGAQIWQWMQEGAHIYVCGDAAKMAKDVEAALLAIIAKEGGMDAEAADEYLDEMRQEKRYQRDVY